MLQCVTFMDTFTVRMINISMQFFICTSFHLRDSYFISLILIQVLHPVIYLDKRYKIFYNTTYHHTISSTLLVPDITLAASWLDVLRDH